MQRVPASLLRRIADSLDGEDRDEMALPSYLHKNPALRFMAWRRLEVIAARLKQLLSARERPRAVLDFGCGSGILFPEMCGAAEQVYGVDLVLTGAELLIADLRLERVRLLRPEQMVDVVADASIDVVVAAEVLEHVDDIEHVLRAFQRVLKPDAPLLVSVPTENALYRFGRRLAGFSGHYHHANAAAIDAAIRRSGFRRRWRAQIPAPGPLSIYWAAEYRLG